MSYECDRCGQTAMTECVIDKDGLCSCCKEELEVARQAWEAKIDSMPDPPDIEYAINRAAGEMKEAIDAKILEEIEAQEEELARIAEQTWQSKIDDVEGTL